MSDSYLFIDGNCLKVTLARFATRYFSGDQFEIDFARLRIGHAKAYYYDAIPVREHTEAAHEYEARTSGKLGELGSIARQDGYHVRAGDARVRRGRGREQKMVDVQLAVDMMAFAHRRVFSGATLLTGDLDFKPLIDALVGMGIDLTLQYPEGETNGELIEAADRALPIAIDWAYHIATVSFRQAHPLPQAQLMMPGTQMATPSFFEWSDGLFGQCRLGRDSDGFELLTSDGPSQRPLYVRFVDLPLARLYLEDRFELKLPKEVPGFPTTG